ncbi:MAG: ATP-binding protein [Flavobacteriales bacterium]
MMFRDCIGQEEVASRLIGAHREGRVAHAQLFDGPEGSGNLALALAYAQFLFCPNKTETDSCGQCPACKKVSSLQYADLLFSFPIINKGPSGNPSISDDFLPEFRDAALNQPYMDSDYWFSVIGNEGKQGIFSVREALSIIRKVSMKGFESPLKIMVIWMAELIKVETANKLLKVLEEPPENTLFFLVANQADQILPTVMSRVQVMRVNRLSDDLIAHHLMRRGVAAERAKAIAHYSAGNWWRAKSMADEEDDGSDTAELFQTWMRACYRRSMGEITSWVNTLSDWTREEQKQFMLYALEQVRQNIVLNYAGPGLTRLNEGEAEFSKKFSRFINDLNAEDLMSEFGKAHLDISRNVNSKMVLMDLSLKVHRMLMRTPQ